LDTHPTARGRRLALVGLTACLTWWLGLAALGGDVSLAASTPTDVSMATAGDDDRVRYGRTITVRGRVSPGGAGWAVRLQFAPRGGAFQSVAGTRTATDGSYGLTFKVRRSGSLRAQGERGRPSSVRRVTVLTSLTTRWRKHLMGTRPLIVRGSLSPGRAGRAIRLQLRARGRWRMVERARTRAGGRFTASWRPRRPGRYRLRVVVPGGRSAAAATGRTGRVYVYRAGHASYYGPGLYGNPTSCGGALNAGSLGVAHKSLPCGTRVTFRYRSRSVTVRVIDRGPFAAGREWDLTAATKNRLGFGSTGTVWSTR
jgi:rare lipoprotein A